ncbi:hypothetical protein [Rathayibacter agropyri]|uniref:hypothetical protein n=1 Tax=Rathayibacter agropyri TaxID=1634927 RepID=UPI001CA447DE|nr:hypothetical protein [Rathayibacter agropyri]NRD10141.1 hypothetical protein [Rathayibacter agropyri]
MIIRPLSCTLLAMSTVLALASCASQGGETAPTPAVTSSFSFPAAPTAPAPSASSPTEKGITGAADASTGSLGFTDGAALHATDELFWAISTSTLSEHGFELDAANSSIANGRWTFRAGDGSVLTALQQRVTDLYSTATDEDATRQVIVASHIIDDPQPATLARQGGGTVEALGGDRAPDADGRSVGALSRSFARTGINLSILAEAPSPARLTETLSVAAQGLEVGFQTGG